MKTLFIAAGPLAWGSSRMRCYWPAPYMDADVVQYDALKRMTAPPAADVYIWQKLVDPDTVLFLNRTRHWLDVCDPAWWWQPDEFRAAAASMAGIVASSEALAEDCAGFLGRPVHTITDRLELSHFDRQAQHTEREPVRLVWFGVAVNRVGLLAALANLERLAANGHRIELTVCDDRPEEPLNWTDAFPVYHTRWTLEGEVAVLAAHDLALLPPYPGPWGKVKSPNKKHTALACGLPYTTGEDYGELVHLVVDAHARQRLGEAGRAWVEENGRVEQSACEWKALLA